ncbi:unnamed protein product [Xylocopa violacea]
MLTIAKIKQQDYYELSAEWTRYLKDEYQYLKQNIGYATFGPPTENAKDNVKMNEKDDIIKDNNITTAISYDPKAKRIIEAIYDKVLLFGKDCIKESCIYYGLIYNITFRTKIESAEDNEEIQLLPTPIFKILRSKDGEVWYIDLCGRVYKNWEDYITNNTLPKCTMVFPKNGFYQPDPSCEITEEYSTVWLEVLNSPACNVKSTILAGADTVSSVVGAVGLGLGIASMFTPLAPVTIGAGIATGISGAWTIGRSTQNLVDKSCHEESLFDRDAFPSWLAIGGSTVGLAASGGSVLLTAATKNGVAVGTATQLAYNSLVLTNVGINGVGVTYQAYCMYEKYQDGDTIQTLDVVFLGAHILFLGNAVINLQFAGELIESTQGKVLDDYRASIRSKNHRKQFNRIKRKAAANNVDKISENAEVIQYINKKLDFQAKNMNNIQNLETGKNQIGTTLYKGEKLKINNVSLINPMKFIEILLKCDRSFFHGNDFESTSYSTENGDATDMFLKLKDLLLTLLGKIGNVHIPEITKFYHTLNDMKYLNSAQTILYFIFKISTALANQSSCLEYVDRALHFIWNYIIESLKETCSGAFCFSDKKMQNNLNKMILALTDHVDDVVRELLPAFAKYIVQYLEIINPHKHFSNAQNLETLNIGGIRFINPTKFVQVLLEFDQNPNSEKSTSRSTKDKAAENMFFLLKDFLQVLLEEEYLDTVNKSVYILEITKFDKILNDMKYIKNATEILFVIFRTSNTLTKKSLYVKYMYEANYFMWNYVKETLKQTSSGMSDEETQNELNRMMSALTDNMDEIIKELLPAFQEYIFKLS